MPIVRFLTPAATPGTAPPASGYAGLDAFDDEFKTKLPNPGGAGAYAYTPYYAGGNRYLDTKAVDAVNDAPMLADPTVPRAIVTGGSMATEAVRKAVAAAGAAAANIAIVQGVGGIDYDNTTAAYRNITGFQIDVQKTCVDQLSAIAAGTTVSILCDTSDATSRPVKLHLERNTPGKTLRFYSMDELQANAACIDQSTFMLIPNADFYNHRATIVGYVEGRFNTPGTNVYAVYPEHEYKDLHGPGNKARVTLHGHHVPNTYRKAARLTGRIWRGEVSVGTLPRMVEADKEP